MNEASLQLIGNADELNSLELVAHNGRILSMAISPDGKYALSGGEDGKVCLWSLTTLVLIKTLELYQGAVSWIAYSPDGKYAASAGADGIYILDSMLGSIKLSFNDHTKEIYCVNYSQNGKLLCSSSKDGTVKIWDIQSGKLITDFILHQGSVFAACFISDNRVISAGEDQIIRMWQIDNGEQVRIFEGHSGLVSRLTVLPDGRYFISASDDGTVRLWDSQTGHQINCFLGHKDEVWCLSISQQGSQILTGSKDGTIRIWPMPDNPSLQKHIEIGEPVTYVSFMPNNRYVLIVSSQISIWDLETKEMVAIFPGHLGTLYSLYYSPISDLTVTSGDDGTLRIWNLHEGVQLGILAKYQNCFLDPTISPDGYRVLAGMIVTAFNYTNPETGRQELICPNAQTLGYWDLETGKLIHAFEGDTGTILCTAFSSDGNHAITGCADSSIRIWDLKNKKQIQTFTGHQSEVMSAAYSPDELFALSGSADKTARLWDAVSGNELYCFSGHENKVSSVAFSPIKKIALTASYDATIRLWDITTGKMIRSIDGHNEAIWRIKVSKDGKYILSSGYSNIIRMWELDTGKEVLAFVADKKSIIDVHYMERNDQILSASVDGTLRIWRLTI
jgi:WD40 repeat protein